uniref:CDC73_C domain-containing protein n=1 Tax=Panagrellus redivivus TaxID=6233 RepID=A0A7E4WE24_PANRE
MVAERYDVLNEFRRALNAGETIKKVVKNDRLFFKLGRDVYPGDSLTNLRVFGTEGCYTVSDLLTFLNNPADENGYQDDAVENKANLIPRPHRRSILAYFKNSGDTELKLDNNVQTSVMTVDELDAFGDDVETRAAEDEANTSIRALNNELTLDKIAQLKNKAKQVKQKGKLPLDQDIIDKSLDPFDNFLKYKTRCHLTVTNVMNSFGDFTNIMDIAQSLREQRPSKPALIPKPPVAPNLLPQAKTNVAAYSRYDQEVYTQANDAFQIQTGMSFHGTALNKVTQLKNQGKPVADPSRALKRPLPSNAAVPGRPQKRTSRTPIIIIPATGTALISMYNVMDILQDLRYVTTEEKKRNNPRKENEVLIHRRKENGQTVPYRIVDNPLRLTEDEWSRVVAVFVQGPAWQFKGWHWDGNPTDIFSHVLGFHMKYDDIKLDPNVAKWSVEVVQLSKNKRHLDKSLFIRLWQKIEQFIIKNKSNLRY